MAAADPDSNDAIDSTAGPPWPVSCRLEAIENPEAGTTTVVEAEKAHTHEATTHWLTIDTAFVRDRETMR